MLTVGMLETSRSTTAMKKMAARNPLTARGRRRGRRRPIRSPEGDAGGGEDEGGHGVADLEVRGAQFGCGGPRPWRIQRKRAKWCGGCLEEGLGFSGAVYKGAPPGDVAGSGPSTA